MNLQDGVYHRDPLTYMEVRGGCYAIREYVIHPRSQAEADNLYEALDSRLSPECIHQDGEASPEEAANTFNYWMAKAVEVEKFGFLPTEDSDLWRSGQRPSECLFWDKA